MANKVDICNRALSKLGVGQIANFNEDSEAARLCKLNYDVLRKKMLRSHWWNFAIRRDSLSTKTTATADRVVEAGSTTTNLKITAHGLSINDLITISQTVENVQPRSTRVSVVVDADNVTMKDTLSATLTAGDLVDTTVNFPLFDYSNEFDVPSDNLRILRLGNQQRSHQFNIEGSEIVANANELDILYVSDVDDVDSMDFTFQEGLVFLLSSELAYPLIQSNSLMESMYSKYQLELKDIRSIDAMVGSPQTLFAEEWLDSRLVGSTLRRGDGQV